jgi:hypothetical protein
MEQQKLDINIFDNKNILNCLFVALICIIIVHLFFNKRENYANTIVGRGPGTMISSQNEIPWYPYPRKHYPGKLNVNFGEDNRIMSAGYVPPSDYECNKRNCPGCLKNSGVFCNTCYQ